MDSTQDRLQLTSTKEQTGDGTSKPELARGDRIKQITTGPTEVQYYPSLARKYRWTDSERPALRKPVGISVTVPMV